MSYFLDGRLQNDCLKSSYGKLYSFSKNDVILSVRKRFCALDSS